MIELLTHSDISPRALKFGVRLSGHTVTVDAQFPDNLWASSFHSVTIFEGDRAVHTEDRTQYRQPISGMSTVVNNADAKWVGACPDDMQPGESISWSSLAPQNVIRSNLLDGPPTPPIVIRGTTPGSLKDLRTIR